MRALAARLAAQGGAALVVDYGYDGPALGDTLQAVRGHGYVNPFEAPGEHDLTAHVDFGTLGAAARIVGAAVHGPRSEEHTSELQSLMRISYAVFCSKKKNIQNPCNIHSTDTQ